MTPTVMMPSPTASGLRDERLAQLEACVVGGGPVGLFAALCLDARGVHVRVVDSQGERPTRSYACGLHAETLRLLDGLGLTELVREAAHPVERLVIWRDLERTASADFSAPAGPFPHLLTLRQSDLEDVLATALAQRGVEVALRQNVAQIRPGEHSVCTLALRRAGAPLAGAAALPPGAEAEPHDGEPVVRDADYLVAADGYDSLCRQALGIRLEQLRPSEAFSMYEFQADLGEFRREAHLLIKPHSLSAFWPLGPEVGRWTFQVSEQLDEEASLQKLRELASVRAPWFRPRPEQLLWAATTQFERRLAARFGRGRVWLVGDAAHVTSPIGFQNMNRGFIEVSELAGILAGARDGARVPASELDAFGRRQRAEWRRLLGQHGRPRSRGPFSEQEAAQLVSSLPASGSDLDLLLARLGVELT